MDDLISRQAAIRFIRDKVSLSLFMKRSVDKADKACMELCDMLDRELPSAQRWIPVTERLPEEYGNYLITTYDGDVDVGTIDPNKKGVWSACDADGFYWIRNVIAWMPLPEPYKGD